MDFRLELKPKYDILFFVVIMIFSYKNKITTYHFLVLTLIGNPTSDRSLLASDRSLGSHGSDNPLAVYFHYHWPQDYALRFQYYQIAIKWDNSGYFRL